MKTLILGAGFTGLAAGIKTGATIFEMSNHAGGICTDYIKDGFRFSNGGPHWIFGKDSGLEYIKSLVDVKEYNRSAGVYYNYTFPYPFQSFAENPTADTPNSMKANIHDKFGVVESNIFFDPFNEKYTAGLYDDIIPQDEYKSPKTGTGWVSTFCDPVGGLSTVVDKMSAQCDIQYNKEATYISIEQKKVFFGNGHYEPYDRLISTIPLDKLMLMCCHPRYHSDGPAILPYTSVLVINIGATPAINLPKEHWLYIPFCNTGFHRVAFYTNVDKSKAPEGHVGLSVEIAFRGNLHHQAMISLAEDVCRELKNWRWIDKVITWRADVVPCAYTWQYNREDVPNALAWLKERDIISTGRYGKWLFQGITQSIMDGFNVDIGSSS